MRIWSYALQRRKEEKLDTKGILPHEAMPAAAPIIWASWIPILKKRSGNSLAKWWVIVDADKSASNTTSSGTSRPSSFSAMPYASRVALPSFTDVTLQFGQGTGKFFVAGCAAMKLIVVFHERNAFAFHGMGDEHLGLALR